MRCVKSLKSTPWARSRWPKRSAPLIADGGKLAIVSSNLGSIANCARPSGYGYNISKAGVNMVGKMLSLELAPRKIAVLLLHPGWVATDMTAS